MWLMQVISTSQGHVKSNLLFSIPKWRGAWVNLVPFLWNVCLATLPGKQQSWEFKGSSPRYLLVPISFLKLESMCCAFKAGGLAGNSSPAVSQTLQAQTNGISPWEPTAFHREKRSEGLRGLAPLQLTSQLWGHKYSFLTEGQNILKACENLKVVFSLPPSARTT